MAPCRKRSQRKASDHSLAVAVEAVKNGDMSLRQAASFYQLPKETIRRHVRGISKSFKPGPKPKINQKLETELAEACNILAASGHGVKTEELRAWGQELVSLENLTPFKNGLPSTGWVDRFKRRQECSHRKPQNVSAARMNNETLEIKNNFFSSLENTYTELKKRGLDASCVYNLDETGLTVVGEGGKVIARKGSLSVRQRTSAERGENITVVATVNASGTVILPPTVIFKGVQIHEEYMNGAMDGVVFATSKSSFTDSELFSGHLDKFIDAIPPKRPVLLLLDGHSSHLGLEVIRKARENDIHMMMFPGHTTHLFQPLDVGVFGPLTKAFHHACCRLIKKNKLKMLHRRHFSQLLTEAWREAVTPANIIGGFTGSGVWPWNPSRVTLPCEWVLSEAASSQGNEDSNSAGTSNADKPEKSNLVAFPVESTPISPPPTMLMSSPTPALTQNSSIATIIREFLKPVPQEQPSSSKRVTTTRMITSEEFLQEMEEKEAKKKKEAEEKEQRKRERIEKQAQRRKAAEEKKTLLHMKSQKKPMRNRKLLKDKPVLGENSDSLSDIDSPDSDHKNQKQNRGKKPSRTTRKSVRKQIPTEVISEESEDNTLCGNCQKSFQNDFHGEKWISCSVCKSWSIINAKVSRKLFTHLLLFAMIVQTKN